LDRAGWGGGLWEQKTRGDTMEGLSAKIEGGANQLRIQSCERRVTSWKLKEEGPGQGNGQK